MATREREKAAKRQATKDTRPRAVAKYIRISPTKVKLVVDLIRGKSVAQAKAILMATQRACLRTCAESAEQRSSKCREQPGTLQG